MGALCGQMVAKSDGLTVGVPRAIELAKTRSKVVHVGGGDAAVPVLCAWCGSSQDGFGTFVAEKLVRCTGCKRVWYCGQQCQKKHKKSHKKKCEAWMKVDQILTKLDQDAAARVGAGAEGSQGQ